MPRSRTLRHRHGFLARHGLSIASIVILCVWTLLYVYGDPKTRWGAFFGNAIADWTGVVVTVLATKYFYEVGSAESRQPNHFAGRLRKHSLTIFLGITGAAWLWVYCLVDPEAKWGQVAGNILSEWTQLLGLVLMTKRLLESKSKESRR